MDLDFYKQCLLDQRAQLESTEQTAKDSSQIVELDQTRVGRLSRMDALQGQAMAKQAEVRRHEQLNNITAALRRIDSGEYGDCQQCGNPIAEKRLRFDPCVTLCIECAAAAESN